MSFMESRHFKCAFEGNPEPIYLVGIWPSRQSCCQHAQTAACLRLRHPWCPDSKSTTIATATSGRNATYRNLLTQRERQREGMAPSSRLQNVFQGVQAPHSTTSLREACNVSCRGIENWPQPMHHPWSHCRFTSLAVNLQEEEEEEAATSGSYATESTYLALLIQETERAWHHFQGCYLS
jgi:hypothetical protein